MNPKDIKHIRRLTRQIQHSYETLKPLRSHSEDTLKQYVGSRYGKGGADHPVPINLIELALSIFTYHLSPREPQIFISSRHDELKPTAWSLELAVNKRVKEIDLGRTERYVVRSAIVGLGAVKVGLYGTDNPSIYVDPVDIDDWFHDVSARHMDEAAFKGNRYRVRLDEAIRLELFKKSILEELATDTIPTENEEDGSRRITSIFQGQNPPTDEGEKYIELYDVWLPYEKLMLTIPARGTHHEAWNTVEWDGPEHGPYHILEFAPVPGQSLPLPPSSVWYALHILANSIFTKIVTQAERQKKIGVMRAGNESDADRINKTRDGNVTYVDNEVPTEVSFGGIDQANLVAFMQAKEQFSYATGGLETLGGLSAAADTLGQEQMITQQASQRIADMQSCMSRFRKGVLKDIAFYEFGDPLTVSDLTKTVSGVSIPVKFGPEQRVGNFTDYDFDVVPYSIADMTPAQRYQQLMNVLHSIILPLAPQMQQAGIQLNYQEIMTTIGRYTNLHELDDILTYPMGDQKRRMQEGTMDAAQGGNPSPKPPVSYRTYERRNSSGGQQATSDDQLMQLLSSTLGKGQ